MGMRVDRAEIAQRPDDVRGGDAHPACRREITPIPRAMDDDARIEVRLVCSDRQDDVDRIVARPRNPPQRRRRAMGGERVRSRGQHGADQAL
jgi:hypothetical protein